MKHSSLPIKWLLCLALLLPAGVKAQLFLEDTAPARDSVKIISLPGLKVYNLPDSLRKDRRNNIIIDTKEQYYALFAAYKPDSLPVIDFSRHQLVAHLGCVYGGKLNVNGIWQCMHRQACRYVITWRLVRRKKEL